MDVADIDHEGTETLRANGKALKEKARIAGRSAMDLTRATYEQIQEKAVDCSQATDRAIRDNPYTALGCAFGVGMLFGVLALRRTKVIKVIKEKH
jgi:ElaB/YqjD/DUF883 family membrane-anchored ribosome-binding protein